MNIAYIPILAIAVALGCLSAARAHELEPGSSLSNPHPDALQLPRTPPPLRTTAPRRRSLRGPIGILLTTATFVAVGTTTSLIGFHGDLPGIGVAGLSIAAVAMAGFVTAIVWLARRVQQRRMRGVYLDIAHDTFLRSRARAGFCASFGRIQCPSTPAMLRPTSHARK